MVVQGSVQNYWQVVDKAVVALTLGVFADTVMRVVVIDIEETFVVVDIVEEPLTVVGMVEAAVVAAEIVATCDIVLVEIVKVVGIVQATVVDIVQELVVDIEVSVVDIEKADIVVDSLVGTGQSFEIVQEHEWLHTFC